MWGEKRFLDKELEDWHFECWAWLMARLGGVDALREAPLVLPTGAFFPRPQGDDREVAEAVFNQVRNLMGLPDWPCTLVERERTNIEVGEFMRLQPAGKPVAGTFESDGQSVIITYDPELVRRPINLTATFAHELAHYVLHALPDLPPGAEEEPLIEELATELAVAYFGFGLIGANGAFEFQQFQDTGRQGWQGGRGAISAKMAGALRLLCFWLCAVRQRTPPSNI